MICLRQNLVFHCRSELSRRQEFSFIIGVFWFKGQVWQRCVYLAWCTLYIILWVIYIIHTFFGEGCLRTIAIILKTQMQWAIKVACGSVFNFLVFLVYSKNTIWRPGRQYQACVSFFPIRDVHKMREHVAKFEHAKKPVFILEQLLIIDKTRTMKFVMRNSIIRNSYAEIV